MPLSGTMIVLPSLLREYSTAIDFDLVTRSAILSIEDREEFS